MRVVGAVNGAAALPFAESTVDKGSEARTDGLNIYLALGRDGYSLKNAVRRFSFHRVKFAAKPVKATT
ncbi:MAG: transposase [Synergistaceae bacterium]|jgi:hypothetical protein|nr:transposase [Synergistaceae bacterium]